MSFRATPAALRRTLLALLILVTATGCSSKKATQPVAECLGEDGEPLPVAPESDRVDRYKPTFANPLAVNNPLFPVTLQRSYVMLGLVDGAPFRTEVTLLPGSRTITFDGKNVQALISQYSAFLDGRLHEVAIDWYAQDDSGAVWYLGEDVFNYEDGAVANTGGTWLAGREGPAAMIMPANPKVGDVYRPENACGIVFEEVTVKQVNVTVDGPRGPITGSIVVEELHMDATRESKTFAPAYGEFSTGSGANLEAMALAIPTDALTESMPLSLDDLIGATDRVFDAAEADNWTEASSGAAAVIAAWNSYRANQTPPRLAAQMNAAIPALTAAVNAQHRADARQAAIDVARSTYDIQLRYRLPATIDIARAELWARQVSVDAAANQIAGVRGDVSALEWTRDRFIQTLQSAVAVQINNELANLRSAADSGSLTAASSSAGRLRAIFAGLL